LNYPQNKTFSFHGLVELQLSSIGGATYNDKTVILL
jgi:hypothetical protein